MDHVVILAGGGGTRLWPASTKRKPKQFLSLGRSGKPLLAETAERLGGLVDSNVWVVTAREQSDQVKKTLPSLPDKQLISEPVGRNTCAAIGLAATHIRATDPNAVIGVMPSDHTVVYPEKFMAIAKTAFEAARVSEEIVAIAITPTRAETGYGYLELGAELPLGVREVKRFVEKPNKEKAEEYLASGNFAWNAGIFFAKANIFLKKIKHHLPKTGSALDRIASSLESDGEFAANSLTEQIYPDLQSVSVDFGVLEKEKKTRCVTGDFGWNDVGTWGAIGDIHPADEFGNHSIGLHLPVDSKSNIVFGEKDHLVVTLGVEDLVIVQTKNATLVARKDKAQSVREVVNKLKASSMEQFR